MSARRVLHAAAVGLLLLAVFTVFLWPLVATLSVGEWVAAAVFLGAVTWWVR